MGASLDHRLTKDTISRDDLSKELEDSLPRVERNLVGFLRGSGLTGEIWLEEALIKLRGFVQLSPANGLIHVREYEVGKWFNSIREQARNILWKKVRTASAKDVKPLPPASVLHKIVTYCPQTGEMRGKRRYGGVSYPKVGKDGYLSISIPFLNTTEVYRVHRVAWKWSHGRDPNGVIDHQNGLRHDNRLANLSDMPQSVNTQNRHGLKTWFIHPDKFIDAQVIRVEGLWLTSIRQHDGADLWIPALNGDKVNADSFCNQINSYA